MARVTVEDCVINVPNRFELCLIASNRAKSILSGAHSELEDLDEKPSVIALREIGDSLVDIEKIRENIVSAIKNRGIVEENNDDQEQKASKTEMIIEEVQGQLNVNKEANFVSENIEVED